eukprot:snap_masked-scaffold719_size106944-processed-gene-0.9 protein:Tk04738 transcript:snap_masked-scaffold719_size106944-processed-gene-0.9-mRNA-1 annotation:"dna polymerase"
MPNFRSAAQISRITKSALLVAMAGNLFHMAIPLSTRVLLRREDAVRQLLLPRPGRPRSDVGGEENLAKGVPRAIRPILTVEGSPRLHGYSIH